MTANTGNSFKENSSNIRNKTTYRAQNTLNEWRKITSSDNLPCSLVWREKPLPNNLEVAEKNKFIDYQSVLNRVQTLNKVEENKWQMTEWLQIIIVIMHIFSKPGLDQQHEKQGFHI